MKIGIIAVKGIPISGGIEKYSEMVAKYFVKKNNEVTIYTSTNYGNKSGMINGVNIIALKVPNNRFLEKIVLVGKAIKDSASRQFDIIHFHVFSPNVYHFLKTKFYRSKTPFVLQMHGIEHERAKWGFFGKLFLKRIEKKSLEHSKFVTVVSIELKRYFDSKYSINSYFIPTGVEIPDFAEHNEDNLILQSFGVERNNYYLFMARIVKEKGCHCLIEAFNKSNSSRKLVIAGKLDPKDNYHNYLKKIASSNKNIIFVGEVLNENKDALLRSCYSFCLPSELEGMSVALLEAMSHKKCCIVSDIPENKYISDGHAILFEVNNIADLTRAINQTDLLSNDEMARIGNIAFEYVKSYNSYDYISDELLKLYKKSIIFYKGEVNDEK